MCKHFETYLMLTFFMLHATLINIKEVIMSQFQHSASKTYTCRCSNAITTSCLDGSLYKTLNKIGLHFNHCNIYTCFYRLINYKILPFACIDFEIKIISYLYETNFHCILHEV
jgi:hypothetical protein